MKKKSFHFLFWSCLVIVLGVMAWLSFSVWKLENRREQELARTRLEETTRLALWRMDSVLASLWAVENARAPQEYFFIAGKRTDQQSPLFQKAPGYAKLYFQMDPEGGLTSPQISSDGERKEPNPFLCNYEFLTSSDIPEALKKKISAGPSTLEETDEEAKSVDQEKVIVDVSRIPPLMKKENQAAALKEQKEKDLNAVQAAVNEQQIQQKQAIIDYESRFNMNKSNTAAVNQSLQVEDSPFPAKKKKVIPSAKSRLKKASEPVRKIDSSLENVANMVVSPDQSSKAVDKVKKAVSPPLPEGPFVWNNGEEDVADARELKRSPVGEAEKGTGKRAFIPQSGKEEAILSESLLEEEPSLADTSLAVSAFAPYWVNGDLFMLRTVTHSHRRYIQGIWVDWTEMNRMLLHSVADLLPNAGLLPLAGGVVGEANIARSLAGLPVLIDPGKPLASAEGKGVSTLELSLAVAWAFALAAAAGVAFLLRGIVRLSERRATFVSAVTHELRTPLTTFNLYTEMLTEGLVPEYKRPSYFSTLRQEALRLTHLVDNVLSFSRLEKSRPLRHPERIRVEGLKEAVRKHIQPRLDGSGMSLHTVLSAEDGEREINTDVTAVEQIMYNLADNAAKYAAAQGGLVTWRICVAGRQLVMFFRDEGPGIPESLRKSLFRPFSRSAEEAAGKKPGVGLGLALSREIARDLGGDLAWEETEGKGACFVLTLPLGD